MADLFNHEKAHREKENVYFQRLKSFFNVSDWDVDPAKSENQIGLYFTGFNGTWPCIAHIAEDGETFTFYSIYPHPIPEAYLPNITEFITRANFGMMIGNFELDLNDGELRYKTGINASLAPLTTQLIEHITYKNLTTFDVHFPGLQCLAEGNPLEDALTSITILRDV